MKCFEAFKRYYVLEIRSNGLYRQIDFYYGEGFGYEQALRAQKVGTGLNSQIRGIFARQLCISVMDFENMCIL